MKKKEKNTKKLTSEEKTIITELFKKGTPQRKIAETVNRNILTVNRFCKKLKQEKEDKKKELAVEYNKIEPVLKENQGLKELMNESIHEILSIKISKASPDTQAMIKSRFFEKMLDKIDFNN